MARDSEWELVWVDPSTLKKHPENVRIYGDQVDDDFVDSIRQQGIQDALVCLPDRTVVSGHKRRQAAIIVDLKQIPAIIRRDLTNAADALEALVHSNKHREKTAEQRAREYAALKKVEEMRARQRQTGGKPTGDLGEIVPEGPKSPAKPVKSGRASDLAAAEVGWSGKTADKAAKVVEEIDRATEAGDTEKAETLRATLNKSVSAASKQVAPPKPARQPAKPGRSPSAHEIFKPLFSAIGAAGRECDKVARQTGGQGAFHKKVNEHLRAAHKAAEEWKADK